MKRLLISTLSGAFIGTLAFSYPATAIPKHIISVPSPAPPTATLSATTDLTVAPDDTLWGLSLRYGQTWEVVASYNHLADPSLIFPGELIKIPPQGTTLPATVAPPAPVPVVTPQPAPAYVAPTLSTFQACVIYRESRGQPQAWNGQYWGLYQFSYPTWVAYGGIGADFGRAGAAEQSAVFNRAVSEGGQGNWSRWDGCTP